MPSNDPILPGAGGGASGPAPKTSKRPWITPCLTQESDVNKITNSKIPEPTEVPLDLLGNES
jgi:hypothetical protein